MEEESLKATLKKECYIIILDCSRESEGSIKMPLKIKRSIQPSSCNSQVRHIATKALFVRSRANNDPFSDMDDGSGPSTQATYETP